MSKNDSRGSAAKQRIGAGSVRVSAARPAPASPKARKAALANVKEIVWGWVKLSGEEKRALIRDLAKACFLETDKAPRFEWMTADELAAEAQES